MGKLHQLLAIEGPLKTTAQEYLKRTRKLWVSDVFNGQTRRFEPLEEDGKNMPPEDVRVRDTAYQMLAELADVMAPYVTATIQKEQTNVKAVADVIIPGSEKDPIFTGMSVPALLNLQARVEEILSLIEDAPTTDPSDEWTWNPGQGFWEGSERITYATTKKPVVLELAPATKEHQRQTQVLNLDERTGVWTTRRLSGALSVEQKKKLVKRATELRAAIISARQVANDIEHDSSEYGKKLLDYLLGDIRA